MVKKKSSKQQTPSRQEFSNSPFKNLRGLSASEMLKSDPLTSVVKATAPEVQESSVLSSDQESFADEMDFLGVEPLPDRVIAKSKKIKQAEDKVANPTRLSLEKSEAVAFLDAIGVMEKTFKDEWPEDKPLKQAVPRRMKQVERGLLKLDSELDLHGLSVVEASEKFHFFLQDSIYQGFQAVLIITGKGLHSSAGPVLRQAIEKLLEQQREQVIEWGLAPRRYGGDGALVLFLRRQTES